MNLNSSSSRSPERQLYDAVMKKDWDKVVEIYGERPETHGAVITESKDNTLHVAISQGAPENVVEKLVDKISDPKKLLDTLGAQNKRNDTPLHYATKRGSPTMCHIILRRRERESVDESKSRFECLVGKRNEGGDTPLFLAALNGDKPTFFYLYSVCLVMGISSWRRLWRRENGDTILHFTIQREYLDLSLLIMHLYKDQKIGISANEEGTTPLDVLASIPSAFVSGTQLSWWKRLCYKFINVKELEPPVKSHVVDIENSEMQLQNYQLRQVSEGITLRLRGYWWSIREIKQKHVWGAQIMKKLCEELSAYAYNEYETAPFEDLAFEGEVLKALNTSYENEIDPFKDLDTERPPQREINSSESENEKLPSALLTATKYGLVELVDRIIDHLPMAIHEKMTKTKRNIVLHAIHERKIRVLKSLKKHPLWLRLREAVDVDGNNVLHLAAKISHDTTWETHGPAIQMQWEVKWFEYVKGLVPAYFASETNKEGKTPVDIFNEEHDKLIKESNAWLRDTSGVYTAVSTLIASGTFAACVQFPGGTNEGNGKANLVGQTAFDLFAIAVLFAFTFSSTATAGFAAVYGSRKKPKDYHRDLPLRLSLGLASLFLSCVSVLLAFYAAHSYEARVLNKVIPLYVLTALPIGIYTAIQCPTYWAFFSESLTEEPKPSFVGEYVTTST